TPGCGWRSRADRRAGEGRAGRRAASRAGLIGGPHRAPSGAVLVLHHRHLPGAGGVAAAAGLGGDGGEHEGAVFERLDRVAEVGEGLEVPGAQLRLLLPGHAQAAAHHLDRGGGRGVVLGQALTAAEGDDALAQRAVVDQELRVAAVLGGAGLVHGLGDRIGQGRHGVLLLGAAWIPSQYRSGAAAALANPRRTGRPPFTGRALDIVLATEASPGPSHAWSAIHTLPGAERSRVCPRRVRSSVTTAPIPISIGQAAP